MNLIKLRCPGYRCKSVMSNFAWRVTSNYAFSLKSFFLAPFKHLCMQVCGHVLSALLTRVDISVEHVLILGRTATPTWTEGTPSYTESTISEFGKLWGGGVHRNFSGAAKIFFFFTFQGGSAFFGA